MTICHRIKCLYHVLRHCEGRSVFIMFAFNGERRKIGILQLRVRPMGCVRRFLQHYIQRIIHMIRYIGLHMNCTGRFYRYPQGRFAGAAAQTEDITKQNTTNPFFRSVLFHFRTNDSRYCLISFWKPNIFCSHLKVSIYIFTHWVRHKIDASLQMAFSNASTRMFVLLNAL